MYLNRIADLNARAMRRRIPDPHGIPDRRLRDKAQEYDHALRESQNAAIRRRSVLARSGKPTEESISETVTSDNVKSDRGIMEESVNPFSTHRAGDIHPDDLDDTDVKSDLGESYVDGKVTRTRLSTRASASQPAADGTVEDGGMLGILAQIYGTKGPGYGPMM